MHHRKFTVFLALFLFATALYLRSQQPAMTSVKGSLVLSANQATIPAGQSVLITFSARLVGPQAQLLQLVQIGANGSSTVVGTLQSIGNGNYSLRRNVSQAAAGSVGFQAKAAVRGVATTVRSYGEMTSNIVQIAVVQAAPPPVQLLNSNLVPSSIVQGQAATISVEATLSTRSPLQIVLRRVDTNTTLATLSPVQGGAQVAMMASPFTVYSGTFNLTSNDPGIIRLEIVATGAGFAAPLVFGQSLPVTPAAQAGNPTNPASQNFPRFGLSLAIPPGWAVNQDIYNSGGPIALDNFGSLYGQSSLSQFCCGGLIPPNGATIDVTEQNTTGKTMALVAQNELKGADNLTYDQITVASVQATRSRYSIALTPSLQYSNIAVYAGQGSLSFKFYLSYRTGDPHAADFTTAFQNLLNSVQFTGAQ